MEAWTVLELQSDIDCKKHAGGKAREDINAIFNQRGIQSIEVMASQNLKCCRLGMINSLCIHYRNAKNWEKVLSGLHKGDTLILQFPVIAHSLFLSRVLKKIVKNNIQLIALIHDLEILRLTNSKEIPFKQKVRIKIEELEELYLFDRIIVHNAKMKSFLEEQLGIEPEKILVLGLFDYLIPQKLNYPFEVTRHYNCIIAGNLSCQKSGYVYNLPMSPEYELYGINYVNENQQENTQYHGSYLADELPFHLCGDFGLVWDGPETRTCSGAWGEYLRYNNPHKVSLYLACGIPVIIWEQAALAEFVIDNNVGFTVGALDEISEKMKAISDEQYQKMKMNAIKISEKLQSGYYTKKILAELGI